MRSKPKITEQETHRPMVILDIEFEKGLFFIAIRNIGSGAAFGVVPRLDRKIVGFGGMKEVNNMNIFKGIEYMPPKKEIRFLLDSATSYFARKQPTQFSVQISYKDSSKRTYKERIRHNLEIYRDIPILEGESESSLSRDHS